MMKTRWTLAMAKALGIAGLLVLTSGAPASRVTVDPDPAHLPAGDYVVDPAHYSVTVKVPHGFSTYTFRFNVIDSSFDYDPKAPEASKIKATIYLYSMSTGYDRADMVFPNMMLGAAKAARATFASTSIQRTSPNKGKITGDFTINGVTKPVVLDTVYNGSGPYFQDKLRLGFSATTTIKRSDFGLTQFLPDIGDDCVVNIEVEFLPKK
jgi:polyisoprenoid-binding protein YceI